MEEVDKKVGEREMKNLLENCKIATCFQGHLDAIPNNVQRILDAVDKEKFKDDLPVAILAVIGPPLSGKSLLTNFLIRCLKAEGAGGWMNQLEEGFLWGKVKNPAFFEPKEEAGVSGGVYLWPEPFKMKVPVRVKIGEEGKETSGSETRDVIVLVMHMHHVKDEEIPVLERFLSIICSKLIEIKWQKEELRLLEHQLKIDTRSPGAFDECRSVVFVARSDPKIKITDKYEEEAALELAEMLSDHSNHLAYKKKLLGMNVSLFGMKDLGHELEDDDGRIKTNWYKIISSTMKKVVEQTLAEEELVTKKWNGEDVAFKDLTEAILTAAQYTEDRRAYYRSYTEYESENLEKTEVGPAAEPEFMTSETPSLTKTEITLSINNITYVGTRNESVGTEHEARTHDMSLQQSEVVATPTPPDTFPLSAVQQSQNDSPDSLIVDHGPETSQASKINQSNSMLSLAPLSNQLSPNSKPFEIEPMDTSENPCWITPPSKHLVRSRVSEAELMETDIDAAEEAANQLSKLSLETNVENEMNYEKSVSETVRKASFVGARSSNLIDKLDEGLGESAQTVPHQAHKKQEIREPGNEEISLRRKECNGNGGRLTNGEANQENVKGQQSEENKKLLEKDERLKAAEEACLRKVREEEEKRKGAEEKEKNARKEMEVCVNLSSSQINQTLISSISVFIKEHLNLNTVPYNIVGIYVDVFKTITQDLRQVVSHSLWNEYNRKVDSLCKSKSMDILEPISSKVQEFNRAVKKKFELYGYYNPKSLEQIIRDEIQKVTLVAYANSEVNNLITRACEKLGEIYHHHSGQIIEHEKSQYSIVKDKVVHFYHEEMRKVMSHAPFNPQKLAAIHENLSNKLVDALKNACHLQPYVDGDVVPTTGVLREELNEAFKSYQSTNETKLKKIELEVRKVVDKYKAEYNKKCEEIFSKYPEGLEEKVLCKLHHDVCLETNKLLEMEIRDKVRKDEPVGSYTASLQTHINSYWSTVMAVNQKNLRLKAERDEQALKERAKEEARQQLKEREKNNQCASLQKPKQSSPGLARAVESTRRQSDQRPELPPLIFHLQSTNIVMGMERHQGCLRNELGEPRTPAFLVFTPDNQIAYGSEALAQVETVHEPDEVPGGFYWSIAHLFVGNEKPLSKSFCVANENLTITHECLLGYIFRKLKVTVEHQMSGRCTKTLLAVPFWLSSTKRCRVKDAAKLAGFSEVYLVNDGAAAAYNFTLEPTVRQSGRVLILVENIDRVDACIYEYRSYEKKVRMLAYKFSHYEDVEKRNRIVDAVMGLLKRIKAYILDEHHTEYDKIMAMVRGAAKTAIDKAGKTAKKEINEFLCLYGNETRWKNLLHDVAKDIAKPAYGIKEETAVIMGCIALARNLNELGDSITNKLIGNVDRLCHTGSTNVVSGNDYLPKKSKIAHTTLPKTYEDHEVKLIQDLHGSSHAIGTVHISNVRGSETLDVRVELTNEGIVTFSDIMTGQKSKYDTKSYIPSDRYKWTSSNLSAEQLEEQRRILEHIFGPQVDPQLLQAKDSLIVRCEELQEKLTNGKLKIKSTLAKELVQKKLDEARQFGNHENSTLDQVKAQLAIVKQLSEKYDK